MDSGAVPPAARREESFALAGLLAVLAVTAAWWALALWPAPQGPEWLVRTRYACFGTSGSGLPDAGGWIALIGGPLGMLGMLLAGWSRGVRGLLRRARGSRALRATLAGMALVATLMVTGAAVRVQQARAAAGPPAPESEGELPPATYPRLDRPAPRLALTSQHGTLLELASLRGRTVLVTFAYAHCTTVCPVVVKHVLGAQALLAGDVAPVVLVVTLDPWRDTPARLPDMAASWALPERDAYVLSGEVAAVETVLDAWELPRSRDERTGTVTHPALVYVVDRDGKLAFATNGGSGTIAALARRLEP